LGRAPDQRKKPEKEERRKNKNPKLAKETLEGGKNFLIQTFVPKA
jgi:hypothetical protein